MKTGMHIPKAMVSLLLAALVSLSACASTGNSSSSAASAQSDSAASEDTGASPQAPAGEPVELTIAYFAAQEPTDQGKVFDAVNEILLETHNIRVTPITVNQGNYPQQVNLMVTGNEKLDAFAVPVGQFTNYVSKGFLLELDALIEAHGQGIIEAIGWEFLDAAKVNGALYGLTTNRDLARIHGFTMSKEINEKYGIDATAIKTFADMDAALAIIKENEPSLTPLLPSSGQTSLEGYFNVDMLGDGFGVLRNLGETTQVVNLFETEEYAQVSGVFHDWYRKGYILADDVTSGEDYRSAMMAGKGYAYVSHQKPGYDTKESAILGMEVESCQITLAAANTNTVNNIVWGIPSYCDLPVEAMKFLNEMYSNPELDNLLAWGIEGEHYQVLESGHITFPEGVNSENTGYGLQQGFLFGNQFQTHIWEGDSLELYKELDAFNRSAVKSAAFGFSYDAAPVKTELAACTNLATEYRRSLEYGLLDPVTAIPEFNDKLAAAGLDKVIAEKQSQLDEWLAGR